LKKQALEDLLEQMTPPQSDILGPSRSAWASGVHIVPKKPIRMPDGTMKRRWRFTGDFRDVNAMTENDKYPIPRMDDLLDAVCGKPYRTTMDMGQGFHQIPIDPKSREITAVTTHRGLYEYHRMPMGLKNAPSHFCRVMHDVLAGLEWICTYTYL